MEGTIHVGPLIQGGYRSPLVLGSTATAFFSKIDRLLLIASPTAGWVLTKRLLVRKIYRSTSAGFVYKLRRIGFRTNTFLQVSSRPVILNLLVLFCNLAGDTVCQHGSIGTTVVLQNGALTIVKLCKELLTFDCKIYRCVL